MPFIDLIKQILGFAPPMTGNLNQKAVGGSPLGRFPSPDDISDITIIEEYTKVIQLVSGSVPVIFVTGGAGTGKSVLIRYLRHELGGNVVVLAFTGVAALNVGGQTIHSFFEFPKHVLTPDDIKPSSRCARYRELDVLIIDEISMVRADLLDAVDAFLRLNGKDRHLPFGGVQVVMIGDLLQLPPVVTRAEQQVLDTRYDSPFFFSSLALAKTVMAPIHLTKSFRQTDLGFSNMLNRVRVGRATDADLSVINSRVGAPGSEHAVLLTPTNRRADEINDEHMSELPGNPSVYEGLIQGQVGLDDDKLPSPRRLALKRQARVMFTRNDPDRRWVNGSLGTVTDLHEGAVSVLLSDTGQVVDVLPVNWETYRYEWDEEAQKIVPRVAFSYSQIPLMLAWAITIHKSQGKTLASACVDLGPGAFAGGQTYVSLSRVRRIEDLSLARPIARGDIFADQRISRFYEGLFGSATAVNMDEQPQTQAPEPARKISHMPAGDAADPYTRTRTMIDTAIEQEEAVQIDYEDRDGVRTTRIIRPIQWIDHDLFVAYCFLRQAERNFRLSRILDCVQPESE